MEQKTAFLIKFFISSSSFWQTKVKMATITATIPQVAVCCCLFFFCTQTFVLCLSTFIYPPKSLSVCLFISLCVCAPIVCQSQSLSRLSLLCSLFICIFNYLIYSRQLNADRRSAKRLWNVLSPSSHFSIRLPNTGCLFFPSFIAHKSMTIFLFFLLQAKKRNHNLSSGRACCGRWLVHLYCLVFTSFTLRLMVALCA